MGLKNFLRRSTALAIMYRRFRDIISGPGWGAFHHDRVYRRLILELLEAFAFTSFVETGTFRGYSCELVASTHPALPVFTSEVYEPSYRLAAAALSKYPNVSVRLESSEAWIGRMLKEGLTGALPLFFLDAHWGSYWPLRDELRQLGESGLRCVIVIDDFEVPGQPQFEFDIDGGGELTNGLKCNLEYIRTSLNAANSYKAIFPKYVHRDAFGKRSGGLMRGHIVLFQNAPQEYEQFLFRPLVQQHYSGYGTIEA